VSRLAGSYRNHRVPGPAVGACPIRPGSGAFGPWKRPAAAETVVGQAAGNVRGIEHRQTEQVLDHTWVGIGPGNWGYPGFDDHASVP
jgi:hypothetical protein